MSVHDEKWDRPRIQNATEKCRFMDSFQVLAAEAHRTNLNNGFDNTDTHNLILHAMIHEEVGEATKAWRKNAMDKDLPSYTGEEAELADAVIRIMSMSAAKNLRVAEAILAKMEFNKTRPYLHGGKKV
jgi:NTP pyrophosphatase (non-canonical NTP hydrolase)